MKQALIIGSEGQDGKLLRLNLINKNYKVIGIGRSENFSKDPNYRYIRFDLIRDDYKKLYHLIGNNEIDEIYYLAAYHQSSQNEVRKSLKAVDFSIGVNYTGFGKLLEIVRSTNTQIKIFYASSSLVFSGSMNQIQTELTPLTPNCLYSVGKAASMHLVKHYRREYDLFVSVGVLYNHESIYRKEHFLSQRIISDTRRLINNEINSIVVGNLDAITDWGYAPDFVEAMWHILQLEKSNDFIVSSGEPHSVSDWFEVLFPYLNMEWKDKVIEDGSLLHRKKPILIGDNSKLIDSGWKPRTTFNEMVLKLFNNEI